MHTTVGLSMGGTSLAHQASGLGSMQAPCISQVKKPPLQELCIPERVGPAGSWRQGWEEAQFRGAAEEEDTQSGLVLAKAPEQVHECIGHLPCQGRPATQGGTGSGSTGGHRGLLNATEAFEQVPQVLPRSFAHCLLCRPRLGCQKEQSELHTQRGRRAIVAQAQGRRALVPPVAGLNSILAKKKAMLGNIQTPSLDTVQTCTPRNQGSLPANHIQLQPWI